MRSLRILGTISLLAIGVACSHPPPPKAAPVPPVQHWLAGARAAHCSDAETLTWTHNSAKGMEMLGLSCDGRGVNVSHNDSGNTDVYPIEAATFKKAWQDTLAQVSGKDCMTSDQIAAGHKLDSGVTLEVQYKRSILGCTDAASRVAEAALRNALVQAKKQFRGKKLQSCCSKHPPCRAFGGKCW